MIADLAQEARASAVHWTESDVPGQAAAEREVAAALYHIGVAARSFPSDLLVRPASLRNKEGRGPARVHTVLETRPEPRRSAAAPAAPKTLKAGPKVATDDLASWNLEPARPRLGWRPARDMDAG